uniref:Uncharacterized protein n=1 Tax=Arundo donax TaxID=35708 RepID=A0A0A8Z039_ARUDO
MDPRMLIWMLDISLQIEHCLFHSIKSVLINPFTLVLRVTWEEECRFMGSHQFLMTFCQKFL